MMAGAIFYAFAIAYIAHRGVNSSTAVNLAINGIQVFALLVFAVLALQYRASHPAGSVAFQFDPTSGEAYTYEFQTTPVVTNGVSVDTVVRDSSQVPLPKKDAAGNIVPYRINYDQTDASGNFLAHPNAKSVISPHHISWMFIQATVAIHPGRLRVRHRNGRRGQERQARHPHCGHHLASAAGGGLLLL